MAWLLLTVAVVLAAALVRTTLARRHDRGEVAAQLAHVRRLVDGDLDALQGDLAVTEREAVGLALDDELRRDLVLARTCLERAQTSLGRLTGPGPVAEATSALAAGRLALAAAQARLAGRPLPALPTVCFFDPRHGMATQQVRWTQAGHGTRTLPGCDACAERLAETGRPQLRTVEHGAHPVPYWEGGLMFEAYGQGYFPLVGERGAAALQGTTAVFHRGRASHVPNRHDQAAAMSRYGYYQEALGMSSAGFSGGG